MQDEILTWSSKQSNVMNFMPKALAAPSAAVLLPQPLGPLSNTDTLNSNSRAKECSTGQTTVATSLHPGSNGPTPLSVPGFTLEADTVSPRVSKAWLDKEAVGDRAGMSPTAKFV